MISNDAWECIERKREELSPKGVEVYCPDRFYSGAIGLIRGGLAVWFSNPKPSIGYWHLHIAVQHWAIHRELRRTHVDRIAEYTDGKGMRLLRPDTFEEAMDTAVAIITDVEAIRKHRDYYVNTRLKPAIESTKEHLARLQSQLDLIRAVDQLEATLSAEPPSEHT